MKRNRHKEGMYCNRKRKWKFETERKGDSEIEYKENKRKVIIGREINKKRIKEGEKRNGKLWVRKRREKEDSDRKNGKKREKIRKILEFSVRCSKIS